jgi:hypothetical protein
MKSYNIGKKLFVQTMLLFEGHKCRVVSSDIVVEMAMDLPTYIQVDKAMGCITFESRLSVAVYNELVKGITQGVIAHTNINYAMELHNGSSSSFDCLDIITIPLAKVYYTKVKSINISEGVITINDRLHIDLLKS